MTRRLAGLVGLGLGLASSACVDTGRQYAEVPLLVAGTAIPPIFETAPGTQVRLDSAYLAFGPFYLCPGASAGDLCETARVEWLGSALVDLRNPTPVYVGQMRGVSGTVQSWMYDLGLSSQLTEAKPVALPAAKQLFGASIRLRGRAEVEGMSIPFSIAVPVQQTEDTELGVPVVRKSVSEPFFRDIGAQADQLTVRFDPRPWMRGLDFRGFLGRETCSPQAPAVVCEGMTERRCQGATQVAQRDCTATGEVCAVGKGCVKELRLGPDSQAFRAIRTALLSGVRPSMTWEAQP